MRPFRRRVPGRGGATVDDGLIARHPVRCGLRALPRRHRGAAVRYRASAPRLGAGRARRDVRPPTGRLKAGTRAWRTTPSISTLFVSISMSRSCHRDRAARVRVDPRSASETRRARHDGARRGHQAGTSPVVFSPESRTRVAMTSTGCSSCSSTRQVSGSTTRSPSAARASAGTRKCRW